MPVMRSCTIGVLIPGDLTAFKSPDFSVLCPARLCAFGIFDTLHQARIESGRHAYIGDAPHIPTPPNQTISVVVAASPATMNTRRESIGDGVPGRKRDRLLGLKQGPELVMRR